MAKNYLVQEIQYYDIEVRANSKMEAIQKAMDMSLLNKKLRRVERPINEVVILEQK